LGLIAGALAAYWRMPFAGDSIPGAVLEGVVADVHGAQVLGTYDFIDVHDKQHAAGWQVKSTKADTPITWKRAKIPNQRRLIERSHRSAAGRQALGDAIIGFCNRHARASLDAYGLKAIGYARLIVRENNTALYFERLLCTRARPEVFRAADYVWQWSEAKDVKKKEQLPALHGRHVVTGKKVFAWHGLGENQLHFSGEAEWWPRRGARHAVALTLPSVAGRLTWPDFARLLPAPVAR
jgi:hypothetical protein